MYRLRYQIDGEEHTFPFLGDEVRVGRGSDNDVVLSDFSVSRQHAAIRREPEGWCVYDLKSTNGVQINRVAVNKGLIRPGDLIKVGVFELAVEADPTDLVHLPEGEPEVVAAGETGSGISSPTIVRSLADFSLDFERQVDSGAELDKVETLDQTYFSSLTRLGRVLIDTDSIERVLVRVMEAAFEALPVDRGFILLDNEEGVPVPELARFGDQLEAPPQSEVPISETILDTVRNDQVGLRTLDALDDQRLAGGESIRLHGIRAAMCAPLWSQERIIGFIQVDSPFHVGTFNEKDLDFLIALGNYAAMAVQRIREQRVRSRLERYHSPAVLEAVMREDESKVGEGVRRFKRQEVTILFADLVDFTSFSETAELEDVHALLEGYCSRSVDAIFAEGGTLDKFIGDCVMAFFGAPMQQLDHAVRGIRAAIRIQQAIRQWNREREADRLAQVRCRIALNSGPVLVGDVGSDLRVDYTVLGNTVNVAARLEESVAEPEEIVVGEATRLALGQERVLGPSGESFGFVPVRKVPRLKGLEKRIAVYRIVAE